MPYKSEKQRRFMQAIAHNKNFADKVGVPQSVGQKFEADKKTGGPIKMQRGGSREKSDFGGQVIQEGGGRSQQERLLAPTISQMGIQELINAYNWDPYNLPEFGGEFAQYDVGLGKTKWGKPTGASAVDYAQQQFDARRTQVLAEANAAVGGAPGTITPGTADTTPATPVPVTDPASLIGTQPGSQRISAYSRGRDPAIEARLASMRSRTGLPVSSVQPGQQRERMQQFHESLNLAGGGPVKMQVGGSIPNYTFDPETGQYTFTGPANPYSNVSAEQQRAWELQGLSAADKVNLGLSQYDWSDAYNIPELNMVDFQDLVGGGSRGDPSEMIQTAYDQRRSDVLAAQNAIVGGAPGSVAPGAPAIPATPVPVTDPGSLIGGSAGAPATSAYARGRDPGVEARIQAMRQRTGVQPVVPQAGQRREEIERFHALLPQPRGMQRGGSTNRIMGNSSPGNQRPSANMLGMPSQQRQQGALGSDFLNRSPLQGASRMLRQQPKMNRLPQTVNRQRGMMNKGVDRGLNFRGF